MHTQALSLKERHAAMDETMEAAPLFGRRTAQQEYDAVSKYILNEVERHQAVQERQRREHMARFSLWCTADRLTPSQESEVNQCLEQFCTGDTIRMLVRACLLGNNTHAFAIAQALREDAAGLYADNEV